MNRQEHLLTILGEECSELHQAVSKTLRFGIDSTYDNGVSNLEQMQKEFNDLLGMIEMLNDYYESNHGDKIFSTDFDLIDAKRKKVELYLLFSDECGTLNADKAA